MQYSLGKEEAIIEGTERVFGILQLKYDSIALQSWLWSARNQVCMTKCRVMLHDKVVLKLHPPPPPLHPDENGIDKNWVVTVRD